MLIHSLALYVLLSRVPVNDSRTPPGFAFLPSDQRLYLIGFVPLEIFCSVLHPLVFGARLPFLPLLVTSVYSSVGVSYCWLQLLRVWLARLGRFQSDVKGS